jgi:hypothetical protein
VRARAQPADGVVARRRAAEQGFGGPITAILAAAPVLWLSFYRLLTPRAAAARPALAT